VIKMKEIYRIAQFYLQAFPGWRIVEKHCIVRESGPVLQGIALDRVSFADEFRVVAFFRVMIVPCDFFGYELPEHLRGHRGGDRMVHLRDYERRRDEIVSEIRRQITPRVDLALDPLEVLSMYEAADAPTLGKAEAIAALHAYFGHDRKARKWCKVFRKEAAKTRAALGDQRYLSTDYVDSLERWLDNGETQVQLDRILQGERKKLGLTE